MAVIFYDHLIPWHKVELYFVETGIAGDEKLEVIELIEETVHTETLVIILHHLPEEKHTEFIDRFHAAPHDQAHLTYLQTHAHPEIEDRIRTAVDKIMSELVEEMSKET